VGLDGLLGDAELARDALVRASASTSRAATAGSISASPASAVRTARASSDGSTFLSR
jgi:hypothetical protein